ncbi:hypothetical protein HYT17_03675 [Candidatus Microgenomates bacterium]|nr:hypothetical protein [Candidatus Microgenomates bacterium]
MNFLRNFLLLAFLALVEIFAVPLPLVFIALFLWVSFINQYEALILGFMIGFVFDLFFLKAFGSTSIFFLLVLFVLTLYKQKVRMGNIVFLTFGSFVSFFVIEYMLGGGVSFAVPLLSTIIILFTVRLLFKEEAQYESWYRLS